MKPLFLLVGLLIPFFALANSVNLLNDSPFTLDAVILSADGTNLGQTTVESQKQKQWALGSNTFEAQDFESLTPFTVVWRCHHSNKEFGISSNIAAASMATAQNAQGHKICKFPKKDQQDDQKDKQSTGP